MHGMHSDERLFWWYSLIMDFIQLKQLVTIADKKVLSHAAETLNISQPALSRSIQNLEDELGIKLFDRTKNRITLNSNGELIVERAKIVLDDVQKVILEAEALKNRMQVLRFATCAPAPMWKITAQLALSFPQIAVTSEMPEENLIEGMLLDGKADLGIIRKDSENPDIESKAFLEEHLYVQIPGSNPLSKKTKIYFKDLEGQTIRVYSKIGFWDKVHRENIKNAQIIETDDFMVHANIVQASDSLSFVTALSNTYHPAKENCVILPIEDAQAKVLYHLAYLKTNKDKLSKIVAWALKEAKSW